MAAGHGPATHAPPCRRATHYQTRPTKEAGHAPTAHSQPWRRVTHKHSTPNAAGGPSTNTAHMIVTGPAPTKHTRPWRRVTDQQRTPHHVGGPRTSTQARSRRDPVEHGLPLGAEPAVRCCSQRLRPSRTWGSRFVGAPEVGLWVHEQKPIGKTPLGSKASPEMSYPTKLHCGPPESSWRPYPGAMKFPPEDTMDPCAHRAY